MECATLSSTVLRRGVQLQASPVVKSVKKPLILCSWSTLSFSRARSHCSPASWSIICNRLGQQGSRKLVSACQVASKRRPVQATAASESTSRGAASDTSPLKGLVGSSNAELLQALGELAWKGVQEAAQDASEIWLNLPPPKLQDTLPPDQLADPDSKFIDVRGVKVHYKEYGADHPGPALLLLHGFGGSTFSWRKVMQPLADQHGLRLIAFDRPPFGLTSRPLEFSSVPEENPYTNAGAAKLMIKLMDCLNVRQAVAVGHSAGASVAVEAALMSPERVSGLILVAPAVFIDDKASPVSRGDLGAQLRLIYTQGLVRIPGVNINYIRQQFRRWKKRVEQGQGFGYADSGLANSEAIEAYTRPMRAENWDVGALLQFQSFTFNSLGDLIRQLRAPVLLVQGDKDKSVPPTVARALYNALQGITPIRYVDVPNCGHLPMEEYPERFISSVSQYVTNLKEGRLEIGEGLIRTEIVSEDVPVADEQVTSAEAAPVTLE